MDEKAVVSKINEYLFLLRKNYVRGSIKCFRECLMNGGKSVF